MDQEAIIASIIHEGLEWQVKYQGTYWRARSVESHAHYAMNSRVQVVGRSSLMLLIRSIPGQ